MSFEFLAVDAAQPAGGRTPLARSPMERAARLAGARFEVRDGWNVTVAFEEGEAGTCSWTDMSHLGKVELQASPDEIERCAGVVLEAQAPVGEVESGAGVAPELGTAARAGETWWCPLTRGRVLAICPSSETAALRGRLEEAAGPASVVEVTTSYAALAICGPLAREVFARFCAIDLRPQAMPVGAFRPGSVARTPGMVLREAEDRYLALFGAALGEYLWTVVADAAGHLGGRPAGVDALRPLEAAPHA